jgi:hypothetical protein
MVENCKMGQHDNSITLAKSEVPVDQLILHNSLSSTPHVKAIHYVDFIHCERIQISMLRIVTAVSILTQQVAAAFTCCFHLGVATLSPERGGADMRRQARGTYSMLGSGALTA